MTNINLKGIQVLLLVYLFGMWLMLNISQSFSCPVLEIYSVLLFLSGFLYLLPWRVKIHLKKYKTKKSPIYQMVKVKGTIDTFYKIEKWEIQWKINSEYTTNIITIM